MGHTPNNLHKLLPSELREQVEHALMFPSPGLSTYAQVYAHFELAKYGVEHGTVERAGKALREQVKAAQRERLRALRELRDAIRGEADVDDATADLMYAELFEHLLTPDKDPKRIFALSSSIKSIVSANIDREAEKRKAADWQTKREQMAQAVERSETETADPKKALSELRADIRAIYGLEEDK